jgi:phosphate-selective porin
VKKLIIIIIVSVWLPLLGYAQGCSEPDPDQKLKVFGYIQPQYNYNTASGTNKFLWNRARLGVTGNIPYDFQYYAVAELSPSFTGQVFLLDAFVTYTRFKWLKMSIGQFKAPFTLELQTPCHKLNTIDRSRAVFELAAPLRDFGIMVFGGSDATLLKYQFSILNGTGIGVYEDNGGKDFVGRVVFNPFKELKILGVGGSFRYGSSDPLAEEATKKDTRMRWGLEGNFRMKNFTVQGEYIYGEDVGSYIEGGGCGAPGIIKEGSKQRQGWYVTAMYMTEWRLQPVFKYEYYDAFINASDEGQADNIQYVTTFGFNYFFNDWMRLQVNYVLTDSSELVQSQIGEMCYDNLLMIQFQAEF